MHTLRSQAAHVPFLICTLQNFINHKKLRMSVAALVLYVVSLVSSLAGKKMFALFTSNFITKPVST
jgi:hypothetical protein